jgi:hypothetical protein
MNTYKVICLKCKEEDKLIIDDASHQVISYGKHSGTNLLSARFRGDKKFGFECICGNDNRVASSEGDKLDELIVRGNPSVIKKITESLKIPDSKQFVMERI